MQFVLSILLTALLQQAPDAGLEGTIVKSMTGEPLSKVRVELAGPNQTQATTTESDGKFYFPNLPPGSYRLTAFRDGYWKAEFGQRWVDGPGQAITLAAGQKMLTIEIVMTPGAVIAGRITDNLGQPLVGARVRAMKPWIQENQRVLRVVQEVVADDRGEYRLIWLLPGRFYLSATAVNWPAAPPLVINPDAQNGVANASRSVSRPVTSGPMPTGLAENEAIVPTYFPTTTDGARAIAIELKQGEEYRDADIVITPTRTFHVRGLVTDLPPQSQQAQQGQPAPPVQQRGGQRGIPQTPVRLTPLTTNGSLYSTPVDQSSGRFDFPKVVPGQYVSYLFLDGMTVRDSVDVRAGDVDGVFLPITAGVDIKLNVKFDDQPPPNLPNAAALNPTLWREPTLLNAPAMPGTPGNPPLLRNISPGDYRVYLPPLFTPLQGANPVNRPANWQSVYVKSMRLGDADVLNRGLHFRSAPPEVLEIVLGANPGTMEGRVTNDRQELVPGAVVTLFADNPTERLYRTDMYRVTSTDTGGRFQVPNLPPGDYRVFAWENIENATWMDTTFLTTFEPRGKTIHVEEGKTSNTDLAVIAP